MSEAGELATLVADLLGALDAWQRTGATSLPVGALDGLPTGPVEVARVAPSAAPRPARPEPPRALPRPEPQARPEAQVRPPPPARPEPVARPEPPMAPEAVARPAVVEDAPGPGLFGAGPAASALFGASPGPSGANLFGGKWAQALRDRRADIERALLEAPPCPACGASVVPRRGSGNPDARLAVMAADPGGRTLGVEGVTMLDKMFVHVLAMERTDAWLVEANTCAIETDAGCRAALLRQLEIVGPRLVLAMGTGAALLGLSADRGRWQRWTDADVLPTWHPNELLARPADKRGAMEHLTQVRGRL